MADKHAHAERCHCSGFEGQFSFELKDADGKVLQTVKNAADGSVAFEPVSFDAAGTYTFTVSEALPKDADEETEGIQSDNVTYDETVYTAVVTVVDNGDGSTSASVAYENGATPAFTNVYTETEEPAPVPTPEPEPGKPEEPETPPTLLQLPALPDPDPRPRIGFFVYRAQGKPCAPPAKALQFFSDNSTLQ